MPTTRTYGEACPIAHSLDMIGDRWAMLVVRELRLGPRRFSDLQASLPAAGPNMLAQRLRDLERFGVLTRRTLPPPAAAKIYELTEWGSELEPVFRALARWGARAPAPPAGQRLSPDSVMLGLRTFFVVPTEAPWSATYDVHLGDERYRVRVVDGQLTELTRTATDDPADATLVFDDHMAMDALTAGLETLSELIERGALRLIGDADAARRLIDAVHKPQPTAT
ncbi:winged helix-turn-helix transcriptional regulator [Phytoactinopolyspora limicola]|uniref:winged helix-turn-helix transcriptional regulator n=1 Tax=Phytoactinopolyspora limicola TaxID=2715536 RepID=UPI00140D11D3|nr:winged helix-turn-helix transcriptional regulator [Phytoactinopolyspora limicola]